MTHRETTKYVSLTNKGYIDYTHNLLSSIKENQIDIDLTIYSLDKDSYNYFSKKNISTKLIDTDASKIDFSKFELQNSSEFYKIVYFKFYCINDLLQTNNYVCQPLLGNPGMLGILNRANQLYR